MRWEDNIKMCLTEIDCKVHGDVSELGPVVGFW
jgi:hypothetical protein